MESRTADQDCSPKQIQSWYDFERTCPQDIRDLIAYAELSGTPGVFDLSPSYATQTWSGTPLSVSNVPVVGALHTDNKLMEANAAQWNFSHLTWNDRETLAEPLKKLVFLRSGTQWKNDIEFEFGAPAIVEVQISFLNNAATRGDRQGTIPVIRWVDGAWTGKTLVSLVLKQIGIYTLGVWTFDGSDYAMYELVIVSVV